MRRRRSPAGDPPSPPKPASPGGCLGPPPSPPQRLPAGSAARGGRAGAHAAAGPDEPAVGALVADPRAGSCPGGGAAVAASTSAPAAAAAATPAATPAAASAPAYHKRWAPAAWPSAAAAFVTLVAPGARAYPAGGRSPSPSSAAATPRGGRASAHPSDEAAMAPRPEARPASDGRRARAAAATATAAAAVVAAVGVAARAVAWAATAPPLFLVAALSAVQPGRLATWAASRLVRLGVGTGLAAAVALGASRVQRASTEAAPQALLALFTERQAVAHNLKDLSSLPVDTLHVYADAACVQADDFGAAQRALTLQLGDVPARVRDALVAKALMPGVSVTKSEQNTAFGIEAAGSASTYMAFYATRYQAAGLGLPASYATCVVVSGVDLRVGEEVVEWQTAERAVQVGTRPCHCLVGGWGCAACPEMAKEVTRRPVLARHALSLDHQMQLHRWMVKQAVERARLVGPREPAVSALREPAEFLAGNLGWLGPSRTTYLGNAAVRGTVGRENSGEISPEQ